MPTLADSSDELSFPGETTGMSMKIKDGSSCRLTILLEGTNQLDKIGIRVPEASVC